MQKLSKLKYLYLVNLSSPAGERPIYKAVEQHRVRSIVEIGVGNGRRAQSMIQTALRNYPAAAIRYTGIDLFDARAADRPGMTLKEAHQLLRSAGVAYKLAPGDPRPTLARTANELFETDLVVVSRDYSPEDLEYIWYYIPRMLHGSSIVMLAQPGKKGEDTFAPISHETVIQLSAKASRMRQKIAA